MSTNIAVNKERFLRDFAALAKFGAAPEGLNREAGSAAFFAARDFLRGLMDSSGLATRVDAAGNLFGVLRAGDKKIISGSHLDSVTNGGIYDGPLGIMAALEAVRSLKENGYRSLHSFEVAAFNAEEGGPLGGTFGSRVFAGVLKRGDVDESVLLSYGMDFDALRKARCDPKHYRASVELHIEQGPVLWNEKIRIGVPTGIVGIARYRAEVKGAPNHAGTTPMKERRDAMQTSAAILDEWFRWAGGRDDFVCNVGEFRLEPGHVSIVPGAATFPLELRSLDAAVTREAAEKFKAIANAGYRCAVTVTDLVDKPPVALDEGIVSAICAVCEERGLRHRKMPSGASHDSSPIARVMPAGMIFVPSCGGISHAKEEFTTEEDMLHGVECLAATLVKLDGM